VRLLEGNATVLGGPLRDDVKLAIRHEKQLPVEAHSEVTMEITLGEAGRVFEAEGSTIPRSWQAAAEALQEMRVGKIVVVGAADMGKSTLCTFLANELLRHGTNLRLVDADIGQADIGPPTTIASALPNGYMTSLADLDPEFMLFIGHTTPSYVERLLIDRVKRLMNVDHARLTLINTDGWVLDPEAILYKINLIGAVAPDLVLAIAAGSELQPILSGSGVRSLNVEAPESILSRSRADRREIRTAGYRRYLEGATTRTINREHIKVTLPGQSRYFRGRALLEFQNIVVGLLDSNGHLQQIGVLLDFGEKSLRVFSRPANNVHEIELGYVKLSTEGEELGYLQA
jgi:polynucleotide 5'-hydroxyl-kinase GRC3/NOL9